jgi:hypothetical protein
MPGKPRHGDTMSCAIIVPPETLKFQQFAAGHRGEGGTKRRRAQVAAFAIEPIENIPALRRGGLLARSAARLT